MRKPITEIENVLVGHGYSVNTIIVDVMKTFNLKTYCHRVGFKKQDGYSASQIIVLILTMPFLMVKSVGAFYKSNHQGITPMKKDTIYRLKNNEKMPWRSLLLAIAQQFQRLVNPNRELASKSAFILDDTTHAKTGRRIEQISMVFDHVAGRQGIKLGFKNLTLGLFDGKIFSPLDFTLQAEKPLKKTRHRKEQYKKSRDPRSCGAKRLRECKVSKIKNGLDMLKRALKKGFRAKYVLVDSWFSSHEFLKTVRELGRACDLRDTARCAQIYLQRELRECQ